MASTTTPGVPPVVPPAPYFDDEDMIDDYVDDYVDDYDDQDFGGPPPPSPPPNQAATATGESSNFDEYEYEYEYHNPGEEDCSDGMTNISGQRQRQEQQRRTATATATATATQDSAPEGPNNNNDYNNNNNNDDNAEEEDEDPMQARDEGEGERDNGNNDNNNNNNLNDNAAADGTTVEEYLAARRNEHNLYGFERYQKNRDWRTTTTTRTRTATRESSGSVGGPLWQRTNANSSSSRKWRASASSSASASASKQAAPEARLLRLLEAAHHRSSDARRLVQRTSRSSGGGRTNVFRTLPNTSHKTFSTRPMTLADGKRVYIRCKRESSPTESSFSSSSSLSSSSVTVPCGGDASTGPDRRPRVLGVTMAELFRRVDGMKRRSILLARKRIERASAIDGTVDNSNSNIGHDHNRNSDDRDDRLWVDKHAPRSFPHLLSDERTNREVLRALRGWDPYVFGKAPPLRPLYQRQREQQLQQDSGDNETKQKDSSSDKRPEESARVILLSGPPGVGKTTLAHIVARHAGYRPVEVNASDERSSAVLKDRIQRAMESTTINFKPGTKARNSNNNNNNNNNNNSDHGKPNCLILDEIDGADARGSIQALVDIVKAEIPSKANNNNNNNKNKQTTSSAAATYLRRPIICICNHKYAPALRPLLPYAAHFNVEPPSSSRLVARLKAILNREKMPMVGGGPLLHQLVVSSGGDIRSSLFTLQFAAAEATDPSDLSRALANSLAGNGLKDDRNDIASTISMVFRKPKPGSARLVSHASGSRSSSSSHRLPSSRRETETRAGVARVMHAVDSLGDDSAAMNALFLNVPRVSYIDPTLDRCSAAHELLSFAAGHGSGFGSSFAVPVVTASIHLLCRVEVKPDLTVSSRELSELKYRRESNSGLVRRFSEGLPPRAKHLKCDALLSEEFIPLAMWVLSAGAGPASLSRAASSIDILTGREQEAARKHVAALCSLGLTYVVDRETDRDNGGERGTDQTTGAPAHRRAAASELRMEPPIHRLVEYGSLAHPGGIVRNEIPSQMKELLAHEVVLEGFRNSNNNNSNNNDNDNATESSVEKETSPVGGKENKMAGAETKTQQTTTPVLDRARPATNAPGQPLASSSSPARVTPRKLDQASPSSAVATARFPKSTPSPTPGNFLGIAAKKGKAAKSARRAAALGLNRASSKKQKLSHTGSGFLLDHVVRMKYVKGFTQAVRTPCRLNDLE